MNKPFFENIFWIVPIFLISAFLYIVIIIQPVLIFHHVQPPFILSPVFFNQYFSYPGGPSELLANLIMQSFYFKITGSFVLLFLSSSTGLLTCELITSQYKSKLNVFWATIPFFLTIILVNNYDFPLASIVSVTFILLMLFVLTKSAWGIIGSILIYVFGAVFIYWVAGSSYMLVFSLAALFVSLRLNIWLRVLYSVLIVTFSFLFPLLVSNYLFAVSLKHQYFMFFTPKAWFMKYEPSVVFSLYILSIPVLLLFTTIAAAIKKHEKTAEPKKQFSSLKLSIAFVIVVTIAVFSHVVTFNSDAKKIILTDYYCYLNNADKSAKTSTSLKQYNFAANLNYNLVMSKTDRLTDNFFSFMQIKGTESLHPDIEFASEYSFIATEFYYNIGFLSEARHWANETLVFYPYSLRGMQNLVKIYLVTGEYKAAERTLNTLKKGLVDKGFIKEFMPYIADTSLILKNSELMEKRSFIPVEKELNTTIEGRLIELIEANARNKKAYEYLMLYYLADAQLEKFAVLFNDVGRYFEKTPGVYEEGLLMYSARKGNPLPTNLTVSTETQNRYNNFMKELEKYAGKTRKARNTLYAEYGKTYLYFLKFVYPIIPEPEIIYDEDDYPEI